MPDDRALLAKNGLVTRPPIGPRLECASVICGPGAQDQPRSDPSTRFRVSGRHDGTQHAHGIAFGIESGHSRREAQGASGGEVADGGIRGWTGRDALGDLSFRASEA